MQFLVLLSAAVFTTARRARASCAAASTCDAAKGQMTVDRALLPATESTSDHQVTFRLTVWDAVARCWPGGNQIIHGMVSGWSAMGCEFHVCQPENHSSSDVGHTMADSVLNQHEPLLPRHQASSHKMPSAWWRWCSQKDTSLDGEARLDFTIIIIVIIMAALPSRCGHYIFALWFLSIFVLFLA